MLCGDGSHPNPVIMKRIIQVSVLPILLSERLRGPATILFISRDTCGDSIAKLFRACFFGVSHTDRAIRCKMGYRTDVPM